MEAGLVGRGHDLDRLARLVAGGRGAVVAGDAGIGKSRLVAEFVATSQPRARWIAVSEEAANVPLGPLVPLGAEVEQAATRPDVATRAFGAVKRSLGDGSSDGQPPVLIIDDAHLLDPVSASVVHQLACLGGAIVVATIRSHTAVPGPIVALWSGDVCPRLDLAALDRPAVVALVRAFLGGPVDSRALQRVWTLSQGNPLLARELVVGGLDSGVLRQRDGHWTLTGSLTSDGRLADLFDARLHRLAPTVLHAARVLAVAGPCDPGLLAEVVGTDGLLELERSRIAGTRQDASGRTELAFEHPLFGEVVRAGTPHVLKGQISAGLAEAVERRPAFVIDRLQLAVWRMDGGLASPDELVAAASMAAQRHAHPLAVRLARAGAAAVDDPSVRLVLGNALAALGAQDEAELVFAQLLSDTNEPTVRAGVAIASANLRLSTPARFPEAFAILEAELTRDDAPRPVRSELVAATAFGHLLVGELDEVVAATDELLASPEASASARDTALVSRSMADTLALRGHDAMRWVDAGLARSTEVAGAVPSVSESLPTANACAAAYFLGDLATARRLVDAERADALEHDRVDLLGLWSLLDTQVLLAEGHARRSADVAAETARLLVGADPFAIRSLVHVEAAHAAAVCGEEARSRRHLDEVPEAWRTTRRITGRFATVRAWLDLHDRGVAAAAENALIAGDKAAADGILAWALDAWQLAVRLGVAGGVHERLVTLARDAQGSRAKLAADHASALVSGEPDELERVAGAYLEAGFGLVAAEAAGQAAAAFRTRGRADRARRVAAFGSTCLPPSAGASSPFLSELVLEPGLTPREREIALLAARGLTSREIGERLHLSRRTVDNRLAGVYAKLGVGGRDELRVLLPAVDT